MKANAITLDRIKNCNCHVFEFRNGKKVITKQCNSCKLKNPQQTAKGFSNK